MEQEFRFIEKIGAVLGLLIGAFRLSWLRRSKPNLSSPIHFQIAILFPPEQKLT